MGAHSKNKGSAGERELCQLLSQHLGGNFERTASSGARVGGSNHYRKNYMSDTQIRAVKSDILTPDHLPKLVVESKSYANFSWHQLIKPNGVAQLNLWHQQLAQDCDPDDFGLLCFKINRRGWFASWRWNPEHKFSLENYAITQNHIVTDLVSWLSANSTILQSIAG